MLTALTAHIGLRYTRAKRRNHFISFVSLFSLCGMALGVFALILVLSVMNGFDHELKQRILRVVPHGYLTTQGPLEDWEKLAREIADAPGLEGSAPFVGGQGLVSLGADIRGIELQGVLPAQEPEVSVVDQHMLVGELAALEPGEYGIIMGSVLARSLGLAVGDRVTITLPQVSITPAGVFPRTKRFRLVGVFEVGAQVDQTMALIHLKDAQTLFRRGNAVDGLRLKFSDIYKAPQQLRALLEQLGPPYHGKNWSETQGSLFQAVKMEKTVVGVMLSIIVAVAAFNIITSLVMMVAEKRTDIAVLRTMGMTPGNVVSIFMVQGTALGVAGILLGAALGIPAALYLPEFVAWFEGVTGITIFDPNVYFVSFMPSLFQWSDAFWVCGIALIITVLATIYPSYRAARIAPAEALRYE
jgi:lipoprotein-releasing system permease protein